MAQKEKREPNYGNGLNNNHLLVALLAFQGYSSQQIADQTGIPYASVRNWRTQDPIRKEIERLRKSFQAEADSEIAETVLFQAEVRRKTHEMYTVVSNNVLAQLQAYNDKEMRSYGPKMIRMIKDITELVLVTDDTTLGLNDISRELDAAKSEG